FVGDGGWIFYGEQNNQTIRKVTPAGVVTTLAGAAGVAGSVDGTGSVARFNQPAGVAVSGAGAIYIGDGLNNTIRVGVAASGPVPPYITSQPVSQAIVTGAAVTFTISAGGASPLT